MLTRLKLHGGKNTGELPSCGLNKNFKKPQAVNHAVELLRLEYRLRVPLLRCILLVTVSLALHGIRIHGVEGILGTSSSTDRKGSGNLSSTPLVTLVRVHSHG